MAWCRRSPPVALGLWSCPLVGFRFGLVRPCAACSQFRGRWQVASDKVADAPPRVNPRFLREGMRDGSARRSPMAWHLERRGYPVLFWLPAAVATSKVAGALCPSRGPGRDRGGRGTEKVAGARTNPEHGSSAILPKNERGVSPPPSGGGGGET